MWSLACLVLCLYVISEKVVFGFQNGLEYDGVLSLRLEHCLEHVAKNPQFSERGAITVQSIRTGAVALQQMALTSASKQRLKKLADKDGIYRLRAFARSSDGSETSFLTYVKACSLIESRMSDILTVSLDHSGYPVAVSMATTHPMCDGEEPFDEDLSHFNTTVFVRTMDQGPVPDTASYIQKLEREKEARDRGEIKDNRSFLAKYWIYIVPVVIFILLSGAANPDGAGAGGGGGGGGR